MLNALDPSSRRIESAESGDDARRRRRRRFIYPHRGALPELCRGYA